jgi:hypothetical protein
MLRYSRYLHLIDGNLANSHQINKSRIKFEIINGIKI